jgi:2Fe-2S ferredoxin
MISVQDERGDHRFAAKPGTTLLTALQQAGITIGAVCGGGMACGTCHVYIVSGAAEEFTPAPEKEVELLEFSAHYRPGVSRLACQVELTMRLAHVNIEVAPDD